ncbi:MAG: hypothetical protein KAR47_12135 [Planctomycetes bacterium]|nr:hypothetical protein [Planctomycetota bacterium]
MNKKQRIAWWVGIIAIPIYLIMAVKTRDPYERFWAWVLVAVMILGMLLVTFTQKKKKVRKEQDLRQVIAIMRWGFIAAVVIAFSVHTWSTWDLTSCHEKSYLLGIPLAAIGAGWFVTVRDKNEERRIEISKKQRVVMRAILIASALPLFWGILDWFMLFASVAKTFNLSLWLLVGGLSLIMWIVLIYCVVGFFSKPKMNEESEE